MKSIIFLLLSALFISPATYAEEPTDELLTEVIEVERFMINWSPSGETLGRAIVYRCAECTPETMTFDQNTELDMNGQPRPIEEIGRKVDWAGLITVTNQAPDKIIKFTIY